MKYRYSITDDHPRDVSLEVEALYLANEACANRGYAAIQDTILGASGYNRGDYAKQFALGFNPVTDGDATAKYVDHKHKIAAAAGIAHKKKTAKEWETQKQVRFSFLERTRRKTFLEVIQNMINRHIAAKSILDKRKARGKKDVYPSSLDVAEIDYILKHKTPSIKYSIHPHVDSLLQERYGEKSLHL